MPNFLSIRLPLLAGMFVAAMSMLAVPAEAQQRAAPDGSYRQSCRNIQMEGRDDLSAECRRQNGNWRSTKIDIDKCRGRDIRNDNGHLECGDYRYTGNYGRYQPPSGSWSQTCRNARIVRDDLIAECRQRDGDWNRTSLDLDDCRGRPVGNDNGRLVCERVGGGNQGGGKWWGQGLPAGSYQRSCRNARLEGRDLLIAQCQRQNGSLRNTRLDIDECRGRDIANDNGHLECGGKTYGGSYGQYKVPAGSWNQSCRNARIVRDDLIAECRERDGGWNRTSLDLDDCRNRPVSNDNGRLRCGESNQGGGGYRMPGGSWAQSCRNAQIRGDDLYAQCRSRDGQWHNTRIDLDRCPNRGLVNDNGELRCP